MGNFSREPFGQIANERKEGYTGLLIEQGVPVLERDLNMLVHVPRAASREYLLEHLRPMANEARAFKVQTMEHRSGRERDLIIWSGDFFAAGYVLRLSKSKTFDKALPEFEGLPREDIVYLDIWEREVNAAKVSKAERDRLENSEDLGSPTASRLVPEWSIVAVNPEDPNFLRESVHTYVELALVRRALDDDGKLDIEVIDLRYCRTTGSYRGMSVILEYPDNFEPFRVRTITGLFQATGSFKLSLGYRTDRIAFRSILRVGPIGYYSINIGLPKHSRGVAWAVMEPMPWLHPYQTTFLCDHLGATVAADGRIEEHAIGFSEAGFIFSFQHAGFVEGFPGSYVVYLKILSWLGNTIEFEFGVELIEPPKPPEPPKMRFEIGVIACPV